MNSIVDRSEITHQDPVRNIAFTPDSRWLFSADDGGVVVMSSVPDGRRAAAWRCHGTAISAITPLPDRGCLVTAAVDGRVCVWRLDYQRPDTLEVIAERRFALEVSSVALRPGTSGVLAISVQTGDVVLWNLATDSLEPVARLPEQANSTAWDRDGSRLAVGCDDFHVYQFDLAIGRTTVFRGHEHHADQVAYSVCGRYLASGSHDRTVRVWDADSGASLSVLVHGLDTVRPDWANDGRLVTASYDQRVRVWRPLTGELVAEIHQHRYDVDDVAWSPDNRWIASSAWDHTARIYSASDYRQVAVIGGVRNQIYALAVDPRTPRCFAGTTAGRLYAIDVRGEAAPRLVSESDHEGAMTSADVSPNGDVVATVGTDSQLVLSRLPITPEARRVTPSTHGLDLDVARFSPNGDRLAVGDRSNGLAIYAIDGLDAVPLYEVRHERRVKAVAWSPVQPLLASGADGNVRVIEARDGRVIATWRAHERMINAVSWSVEGDLIATASWDRTARIFTPGGVLRHELAAHRYNVNAVEFTTAGILATASWDGDVGIWDARAGRLLAMVTAVNRSPVQSVRWLPGTTSLLAATSAGQVMLIEGPAWSVTRSWQLPAISAPATPVEQRPLVAVGEAREVRR